MKEGLCEAVARERSTADGEGSPSALIAEEAAVFVLDTSIDLAGNPCPQRLTMDGRQLMVGTLAGKPAGNRRPERRRQWPWEQIEAFRVEPTVGSHFLQVQIDGRWSRRLAPAGRRDAGIDRSGGPTQCTLPRGHAEARRGGRNRETRAASGLAGSPTLPLPFSHLPPVANDCPAVGLAASLSGQRGAPARVVAGCGGHRHDSPDPAAGLGRPGIAGRSGATPLGQLLQFLLAIVAGLLLARLAATLVAVWKGWVSSRVGTTLTSDLRTELVSKLNQLPLAFYDRNQAGVLMSQVAYDTETLHTLVYHMTSGFLMQSLQLAGIGVMLFYYNAKLALVTLLPMPLILAGSWYFTRYLQPRHQHYWAAVGKQASALMGMLTGIRVVKAFVQEDREIGRFAASSRRLRDSRLTVDNAAVTFTAGDGSAVCVGRPGGVVSRRPRRALRQHDARLADGLPRLAGDVLRAADHDCRVDHLVCQLLQHQPPYMRTAGRARRKRTTQPAVPLGRFQGGVEFQHVSFGYDRSRPVLEDISFAIEPGEMVGVVGRSGSGKSTLVSLIGRLYQCDAGQIRIDGIDVRQADPRQLRRQIGMVPQEPFLFRGLVAANITYGNAQATPEQILLAARNADSHEFIMRMPFAYETQLGEGGSGLSGGERQRLSIARALLFDPAILILDEATASVDAESERAICRAIRRWARRTNHDRDCASPFHAARGRPPVGFRSRPAGRTGEPGGIVGPGRIVQHPGRHPVQP